MSQISIIKKSDIQEARRFDAEFFKLEYLEIEEKLKNINNNLLDNLITKLTDYHANGSYQILKQHVDLLDKPDYALMIRTVDFETDNFENNVKYISENAYNFLNKTKLYGGEIIINKIGNAGRVYFMPHLNRKVSLGMNQFMFKTNNKINNYFLYIFLISKFGKKMVKRRITGAVPLSIDKQSVKNITIPILLQSFQLQIEKIVKFAYEKQTKSKQLYKEAEEALLKELDLLDYKPEHILSYETTKKETDEAKRFDAEYFQPKYEEITKKIEKYEVLNLSDEKYFKIITGTYTKTYSKEGSFYIRSVNINEDLTICSDNLYKTQEELDPKFIVKTGDIITSRVGSIGTLGFISDELNGSFISDNILRIRNIYSKLDNLFLAFYLKKIGTIFMERLQRGSVQQRLNQETLKEFKIPLIKSQIQKQIADKIQESHKLRKESKELLEKAKRKVEEEIEKASK